MIYKSDRLHFSSRINSIKYMASKNFFMQSIISVQARTEETGIIMSAIYVEHKFRPQLSVPMHKREEQADGCAVSFA